MYKSWSHHWKDIIRTVFFTDAELKELMLIPDKEKNNIVSFVSKYFIESPVPDALVESQDVRVNHYESEGYLADHPMVTVKNLHFDIYVATPKQLGVDTDALVERDRLIFERIRTLLSNGGRPLLGVRFQCIDDFRLYSKQEGFNRYRGIFTFKKVY